MAASPSPEQDISPEPQPANCLPRNLQLPLEASLLPCTADLVPFFRRVNSLLLPVRYPDSFYNEILNDAAVASLTRVIVWRDPPKHPGPSPLSPQSPRDLLRPFRLEASEGELLKEPSQYSQVPSVQGLAAHTSSQESSRGSNGSLIGGIRSRVEFHPSPTIPQKKIYILTLCLLSPYRSLGLASALLQETIHTAVTVHQATEIYAHVWEMNYEALEWYAKRGFTVSSEVLPGYYRRLKPSGARLVKKKIGVAEWVGALRAIGEFGLLGGVPSDLIDGGQAVLGKAPENPAASDVAFHGL
ncbi:MAG: hypothetical protein M1829_000743 [Trizodia sp. TS-e1964]|nr:MAG: hypothetical protein M1829_000743 [Trizodia sp. TS-e1964]